MVFARALGTFWQSQRFENVPLRLIEEQSSTVRSLKGQSGSVIKTGRLVVHLDTRTVEIEGQPLHLTGKE
jgi:hypothetical protein